MFQLKLLFNVYFVIFHQYHSGWTEPRENPCLPPWKRSKKVGKFEVLTPHDFTSLTFSTFLINMTIFIFFVCRAYAFWVAFIADGSLDYLCGKDLCQVFRFKQQSFPMCCARQFFYPFKFRAS